MNFKQVTIITAELKNHDNKLKTLVQPINENKNETNIIQWPRYSVIVSIVWLTIGSISESDVKRIKF